MAVLSNFRTYLINKAGISEKEFETLSSYFTNKQIPKHSIVLHAGDICSHSFFIEKGLLRAYTIDNSGKEHILMFASENWFISDFSSVFFKEPSNLFIDAIEETTAVLLDENFSCEAIKISPSFGKYNERALQNHIRHQQQRINLLISATAEERYLHFINLYPDLTLRVPQWMIASYLGITPESLSRVRKNLATKNFKP